VSESWFRPYVEGIRRRPGMYLRIPTPAGLGATLVLCRLLGVTRIDLATLGLPAIISPALIAVVVAVLALRFIIRRGKPRLRRRIAISVLVLVLILLYPFIHWSHVILVASLLTIVYTAAVSLALPEQIEGARRSLAGMSDESRTRLAPLMPHLGRLDGDAFFGFVVDRTLDGLERMVAAR